ncbi:MAG: thioredoxin family protein [Candidatus Zixiibacteriota bacterium]
MASKRKIELFTAGCPVCNEAVEQVKAAACPDCDIIVYDLNKGCETNDCRNKVKMYGIKSVPAVVIDGKLADCCNNKGINIEILKQAGLGKKI